MMEDQVRKIGALLCNADRPLKERFRALFTLRNIGGKVAIDCIAQAFQDSSALLKHELAYCLGQMQDTYAIPYLIETLKDTKQEPIVRHEAAEALGAIGSPEVKEILEQYRSDPEITVSETCQIAVKRLEWLSQSSNEELSKNPYLSVDPAPPLTLKGVPTSQIKSMMLDNSLPLFERYRAMFELRNRGTDEAILAIADGFTCKGSLFRHEIAYVLGQIQSPLCVKQLVEVLEDMGENEMVRHECAEALGSIASEGVEEILEKYLKDEKRVVRESCEVALDMCDYSNSNEFQYANTLGQVQG